MHEHVAGRRQAEALTKAWVVPSTTSSAHPPAGTPTDDGGTTWWVMVGLDVAVTWMLPPSATTVEPPMEADELPMVSFDRETPGGAPPSRPTWRPP